MFVVDVDDTIKIRSLSTPLIVIVPSRQFWPKVSCCILDILLTLRSNRLPGESERELKQKSIT